MNPGRFPDLGGPRIIACLAAPRGFSQPNHVLHRLWTPRHPPYTLRSLTTLFLNSWRHVRIQFTLFSKNCANDLRSSALNEFIIFSQERPSSTSGGGDRIRTDDRLVANQVLYQLSYAPEGEL